MFGRKTLEFMLICIGDEMRDSLLKLILLYPLYVIAVIMLLVSAVIAQASALLMEIADSSIQKTRAQKRLSSTEQTH